MRNADRAWLAGLYEGEGSLIRLVSGTYAVRWNITLSMTDEDVVRRACAVAAVGNVYLKPAIMEHWKPQWRWNVTARDEVALVIHAIHPFLGLRRRAKADEFLEWYASKPVRVAGCCKYGHVYDYTDGSGRSICLECARRRAKESRSRRRASAGVT